MTHLDELHSQEANTGNTRDPAILVEYRIPLRWSTVKIHIIQSPHNMRGDLHVRLLVTTNNMYWVQEAGVTKFLPSLLVNRPLDKLFLFSSINLSKTHFNVFYKGFPWGLMQDGFGKKMSHSGPIAALANEK